MKSSRVLDAGGITDFGMERRAERVIVRRKRGRLLLAEEIR
jgi:hypothetical protein